MQIQQSVGIKGKRNQPRIEPSEIDDDFVESFPLSYFQKMALNIIYFMRAVTLNQLAEISGHSHEYVRKEMLKLHLNGFVLRKFPPRRDLTMKGSEKSFFLLDRAGAIYISGCFDIPIKEVKWEIRDNLIDFEKLKHTLQISQVRARLEVEARSKAHKIVNCMCDRHLYFNFNFDERSFYIRPDLYFVYNDGKSEYSYFCEIDRGTVAVTGLSPKTNTFTNKVPVYEALRVSREYKKYFDVFPRILVFTTTTNRAKNMMEAVRNVQKVNGQSKAEFLFTTFDLWEDNPLGKIFKKSDKDETISMFN